MKLSIILAIALHLSSGADTITTRNAIKNGNLEGNNIMQPFVNSSPKLFAIQQAGNLPLSVLLIKYPKNKKFKIAAICVIAGQSLVAYHNSKVKK